jgi:D-arabinose 1-dehydrogenase-like Zn-dependent alcohol dehydrogenase
LTPGHEMVGRVVATGNGVVSPQIGERVMAYFYLSCFRCHTCLSGAESLCERLTGWYGVHRDGGYASHTILPSGNAVPLPEGLPSEQATVIPDAVATPVHVCRSRLQLASGDRVAIIGAGGGVGIHMVQVAQSCGAMVAGLERTPDKLALVERHGAIPVDSSDLRSAALADFGGDVDVVIDLVGSQPSLSWGLDHLRMGGRLCVLTTFRDVVVEVNPRDLVLRESSIVGSRYASRSELMDAAQLVLQGSVTPVVGCIATPDQLDQLHQQLRTGTLSGRGALVWD